MKFSQLQLLNFREGIYNESILEHTGIHIVNAPSEKKNKTPGNVLYDSQQIQFQCLPFRGQEQLLISDCLFRKNPCSLRVL